MERAGKTHSLVKKGWPYGLALLASLGAFAPCDAELGSAGWSSPVARQAHNLKVVGSNPTPATNLISKTSNKDPAACSGVLVFEVEL